MSPYKMDLTLGKRGVPNLSRRCGPCSMYILIHFFSLSCCTGSGLLKANLLSASSALTFHTLCWLLNHKLPVYFLFLNKQVPFSSDTPEPKQVLHWAYPSWDPLMVTCSLCRKPFLPAAAIAAVNGILFPSVSAATLVIEVGWEASLLVCVLLKVVWYQLDLKDCLFWDPKQEAIGDLACPIALPEVR